MMEAASILEPVKAPWIRPGVVLHEPTAPVDGLLASFALTLRDRGFAVGGHVRADSVLAGETGPVTVLDLRNNQPFTTENPVAAAIEALRHAMRDDADLVVLSHLSLFETATRSLKTFVGEGASQGLPVLTSIANHEVAKWYEILPQRMEMIAADIPALWRWWGPERLYHDLALGVAEDEVRRIACGPRWIMVEGPHGAGVAYLPRHPKNLLPRLPQLARQSLRQLAGFSRSWDPVEMALGVAAINAHYNRYDLEGLVGNGAQSFSRLPGRIVVVGAFPGLSSILPHCTVIETDPRPGEFPLVAMDHLLPGCGAAIVNSSTLINRNLPRILRLSQDSKVGLVGPSTPLTPRLYSYGVDVLGGLQVRDPAGLGTAIEDGAQPRDFGGFGRFIHIRAES